MRLIKPKVEILDTLIGEQIINRIATVARTCFTSDTEVLTDRGFIRINEIDNNRDKVLTYNPETNCLEYEIPNVFSKRYDGSFVECVHNNINFLVTADHRIYQSDVEDRNYSFIPARELIYSENNKKNYFRLPKYFKDSKRNLKDFEETVSYTKVLNMGKYTKEVSEEFIINDNILTILASYITEGHTFHGEKHKSGSYICITQSEDNELYKLVLEALTKEKIKYNIDFDRRKPNIKWIKFGNQCYVDMFEELCGRYSKNKHLPNWFRNLSDRQLKLLLKILYLGDGSHNKTRIERYLSISNRLLNEIQEIFILIGRNASMHYDSSMSQKCYVQEHMRDSWVVNSKRHIIQKRMNDTVYCTQTNNGIICIRHNNKTLWIGNCYKSEDVRTKEKDKALVKRLIESKHEAMLEFVDVTVKFTCSRAIAQEITRHRMASYAMESQRYICYARDKFNHEITYIIPSHAGYDEGEYSLKYEIANGPFLNSLLYSEKAYFDLIEDGWSAQEARDVLPNATKTEINMKANLREWRHFFKLRCHSTAHPDIRQLALDLLKQMHEQIPIIFDDLYEEFYGNERSDN